MMQEEIEPTQPEDVNRNSFPESSSGQVKVEKNVRVSDESLQNKFQSDPAEKPDINHAETLPWREIMDNLAEAKKTSPGLGTGMLDGCTRPD